MRIVVLGAGGFAREVRWLMDEASRPLEACCEPGYEFVGYVARDYLRRRTDHAVLGGPDWFIDNGHRCDGLAIGIGSPGGRQRESDAYPQAKWPTLVHPSAQLGETCELGRGVQICAGAIATVDVVIGDFAAINLNVTLGHGAYVGNWCVINPGANISGDVALGAGVLVGTGAQILQGITVGHGATVGAGAVVTKNVPPGATVVGVPARQMEDAA